MSDTSEINEENEDLTLQTSSKLVKINTAPKVDTKGLTILNDEIVSKASTREFQDPQCRTIYTNPRYEDLEAPILGPENPEENKNKLQFQNHWSGFVEDHYVHPVIFDQQYRSFQMNGYTDDPSGQGIIEKDKEPIEGEKEVPEFEYLNKKRKASEKKTEREEKRKKELEETDPTMPFELVVAQPWANKEVKVCELTEEQKAYMEAFNKENGIGQPMKSEKCEVKTVFHGKEEKDFSGRGWLEPPREISNQECSYCYVPKRSIHTWSGHTKGVNCIKFFPKYGHLLLSAGLDGRIKIWDVMNTRKCMRTYLGHSKGVRGVYFNKDGRRFISTGYDCNIRHWDTETGKVLRTINNKRIFYVAKNHPEKQNIMLAGCADKKIYQYDLESGDLIQEYDYHLDAVNTITFLDNGLRFVSSSDDKTLRVWEFGIPVQIKYIADPGMHSMPVISLHPSGNHFCGQSQDNQIVTYSTRERFRINKKKAFKGHINAGYACDVNFSPDGQFVISGDSQGRCFFWEWQNPRKIVRTFKAHDKSVCVGATWHPMETSKVATCGWDGLIKYWD